jgi:hypothetical protein
MPNPGVVIITCPTAPAPVNQGVANVANEGSPRLQPPPHIRTLVMHFVSKRPPHNSAAVKTPLRHTSPGPDQIPHAGDSDVEKTQFFYLVNEFALFLCVLCFLLQPLLQQVFCCNLAASS